MIIFWLKYYYLGIKIIVKWKSYVYIIIATSKYLVDSERSDEPVL